MKYCEKCGNELLDEAVICPKCGCNVSKNEIINKNNAKAKEILFTGHLLNILSFIIPVVMLIITIAIGESQILDDANSSSSNAQVSVSVGTNISENGLFLAIIIGVIIFVLGIVIYFIKTKKIKTALAYIYLTAAIADFVLFLIVWMNYIVITCWIGSVALIPGILQIVAGTKFIKGCALCER